MPDTPPSPRAHEAWARFRFSVVGPLLAAPPARGELQSRLRELAAQRWRHPIHGEWVEFGASTIERWYYLALNEKQDPVAALRRKLRSDSGQHAHSDAVGHLFQSVSDSIPWLSDSVRSEATH